MLHCNGALAFLNLIVFFNTWLFVFLSFAAVTAAGAWYSYYVLDKDFSDE